MAKISPVGSNMTVLHGKKYDVLFSYETPVAAKDVKTGEVFKTSKKWSATTSKHISKWLAGEKASEKPQEFFDDLDESKKDPAKQIAEALNIMLKDKTLNESNEEESEDGIWWSSSSGRIEIQLTKDQAESASVGGVDNESAIDELLTNPEISSQFDDISDDILKSELEEYGAWDDEELSDREMNIKRVIWLAAGEISDGLVDDMNESEEYEDLDEAKGDSLQNALDYLNKLIAAGKEFPDASSNAAIKFDVDIDDLTAAYDNQNLDESNLNESTNDWSNKQVIDSRDIIERLQELEDDIENLDESDKEELEVLREFKNAFGDHDDWKRGIAIINRSYFVEHVKELLADIGIPENLENFPSYIAIDWDATANNIERDYSSYDINGTEFLARD